MRRARSNGPLQSEQSGAHPLADALSSRLAAAGRPARVLLLGAGDGRNIPPLIAAHLHVDVADANARRIAAVAERFPEPAVHALPAGAYTRLAAPPRGYAAVLSTHALLHGDQNDVAAMVAHVTSLLSPGGLLYATFGSRRDPRCRPEIAVREGGWAEPHGSEAGVVHAYFDRLELRRILAGCTIERCAQTATGALAGRWAHAPALPDSRVHWFVMAHRRLRPQ